MIILSNLNYYDLNKLKQINYKIIYFLIKYIEEILKYSFHQIPFSSCYKIFLFEKKLKFNFSL